MLRQIGKGAVLNHAAAPVQALFWIMQHAKGADAALILYANTEKIRAQYARGTKIWFFKKSRFFSKKMLALRLDGWYSITVIGNTKKRNRYDAVYPKGYEETAHRRFRLSL